jgi:hypothetical protein
MPIENCGEGCLRVTKVTENKLDALLPWLMDGKKTGSGGFSGPESLEKVKDEKGGTLGVPVFLVQGSGRKWSFVDIDVNLLRKEVFIRIHKGQPDVDISPIAEAIDNYK